MTLSQLPVLLLSVASGASACAASRYTFRLDPGRQQVPLQLKQGITVAPAQGVWVMVRSR
jgi:hypothetical protein